MRVVITAYKGSGKGANQLYGADCEAMEARGYFPTSQSWAPGSYGLGSFMGALFLWFMLIGVIIFLYLQFAIPAGVSAVTNQFQTLAAFAAEAISLIIFGYMLIVQAGWDFDRDISIADFARYRA